MYLRTSIICKWQLPRFLPQGIDTQESFETKVSLRTLIILLLIYVIGNATNISDVLYLI